MSRFASLRGSAAVLTLLGGAVCAAAVGIARLNMSEWRVGPQEDGSYLVSSNQTVTPAGVVRQTEGTRPKDLAVSPDGKTVAVLTLNGVAFFRASDGSEQGGRVPLAAGPLGIAWAPDGNVLYASMGKGKIATIVPLDESGDSWKLGTEITLNTVGADGEPDASPRV
jgi:DNA-binding beta-propeller fold protein YncE